MFEAQMFEDLIIAAQDRVEALSVRHLAALEAFDTATAEERAAKEALSSECDALNALVEERMKWAALIPDRTKGSSLDG